MIALTPNDLPVGQPLPWSLLDEGGNLVLGSGSVIPEERDIALVFRHGAVCRPTSEPGEQAEGARPAHVGPLGLQVGTLLQIKSQGQVGRAAASRLIGFVEQGLFVTWPQLGGKELQLQPGETILLRGFSGHAILSFESTVTAICRSPFRYLVLSAPAELKQIPVRKAARVPTRLAAYLVDPGGGAADEAPDGAQADAAYPLQPSRLVLLTDLSTGGAQVELAGPVPAPGTPIRLCFHLRTAALDSEIMVDGVARSPLPAPADADFPVFGVAFDMLGERELTLLQCFIYEQLLASASMQVPG
ncbi:flagellar brake protein [Cupriavidus basilensis]|uniref:Flagellar brake protein n=1 Tax=Cupriavidus basilensis TaxID=68895 RepID=A0ABT6AV64_9BURK|nr:flagellar brake protein [Cupriavidus basilensis]MDF3836505.1 flagellar brake protein [Cupriavidus basilensis]